VDRHLRTRWQADVSGHTQDAFRAVERLLGESGRERIFDSGCGTGQSTRLIAGLHPDSIVVGIDKSAARLQKAYGGRLPARQGNIVWVRAELAGFWRLALLSGWRLKAHYLLYPNPWPKPGQLQRRWHAHPVFPTLLDLGGRLEMRTNWRVYAEEFASAVEWAGGRDAGVEPVTDDRITTAFERKYRASGHELFAVVTADPAR
jgi:tRNA G46 methylase TrmB